MSSAIASDVWNSLTVFFFLSRQDADCFRFHLFSLLQGAPAQIHDNPLPNICHPFFLSREDEKQRNFCINGTDVSTPKKLELRETEKHLSRFCFLA